MTVEVRLKEIRNARGISQNELARKLEMSLANVQKIEYGKAKSIPLDTLDKLCQILECEVGQLLVRVPDDDGSSLQMSTNVIAIESDVSLDKLKPNTSHGQKKAVGILLPLERKLA